MPVTHPFVSGKADGADATLVRASNWNASHIGNNGPTLVVAASDSSAKDISGADYTCDGTADEVQIQAALDAVPSRGGTVVLAPGLYTETSAGLIVTANKKIDLVGPGALISVPASTIGLRISQGVSTTRGLYVKDVRFTCSNNVSATAISFQDTNWSGLFGVQIDDSPTAILMNSATAANFVEGITLQDVVIRNATTYGIEYRRSSGTNSFGQHNYRNVNIVTGGTGTGVQLASTCSIYRSRMQIGVWIDTGQTGFFFDGDTDNAALDLYVEGASGATGNTAFSIGTNATNLDKAVTHISMWGTIATTFSNAFNKDMAYHDGRTFKGLTQATTSPIRVSSQNDTAAKITLGINGVAGGRVTLGNGSGTNDVYIERNAANKMVAAGKWDPSSLNLQTTTTTPVDGDVVGGAADGDVIADSTNHLLYVRLGSVWQRFDPQLVTGLYAPGSFTLPTGRYAITEQQLQLVTTDQAVLAGTARMRIMD